MPIFCVFVRIVIVDGYDTRAMPAPPAQSRVKVLTFRVVDYWPAPLKLVQPSVSPNPYVGTICLQERTTHETEKVHYRADHHEPA